MQMTAEGEMEVGAALVADTEALEAGELGEGSFHHPPVPSQMGAAVHAASRDPWLDPTGAALPAAASVIVVLVGVQLVRALARPTMAFGSHALHGVQGGHQHHAVVPSGPAQDNAERRAAGGRDEGALRARPAAIRWAGTDFST